MNKKRALELLTRSKPELQARFDVTRLALFGSTARDAAKANSDVDILLRLMVQQHLSAILVCNFI